MVMGGRLLEVGKEWVDERVDEVLINSAWYENGGDEKDHSTSAHTTLRT